MHLTKMNIGIKFTSALKLTSYIANNTAKRKQFQHDEVLKPLYKLLNNAVFGKTIENVAKRSDIRLTNDATIARKLSEKPHCIDFRIFAGEIFKRAIGVTIEFAITFEKAL
jgi:hypothetical protein